MKTIEFKTRIAAPVAKVWETMLDSDAYRKWTVPFMEGSYYEGSWDEGAGIHFLAPNGEGMCARIKTNRRHELLVIEHLGVVKDGVEDTTSEQVREWAPAYETYRFAAVDGGTEVTIEQAMAPEHEEFMTTAWTRSLDILKDLCEPGD